MYETQERAKRITDIHVLWGQSTVIEELIQAGKIDEEYIYPFNGDEVLEWWLVTPWLAERLKEQGEIIIDELGCRWWGRLTSGQAILHGRRNTRNLRGRLTQLTTNKVSIPYSRLLDRNFVFRKFDTATIPKSGIRSLRFQNMFYLCK